MTKSRSSWTFLDTPVHRSFVWSLTLSTLPVVSSFVVSWVVARFAGPGVWGAVSWAMALATAALIFAKFGVELGASRLASEYGRSRPGALRRLLFSALSLRLAFTVPVAILVFAFAQTVARWFGDVRLVAPVRVAAGVVACASLYEFGEQFLIGLNRHGSVARIRAGALLSRAVFVAVVVSLGWGATRVLSAYCVAWVVSIVITASILARHLPPRDRKTEPPGLLRRLTALSVPLAISSASVTVYSQMDKLMIGYFDGVWEVGQYAVARNVAEVALFPSFAMVMTLRPALASRFSEGSLPECAELIRRSLRASLILGAMAAAVLGALSAPLFEFVYSSEFRYAGALMVLFTVVIAMRSLGAMLLPALVAAERTRFYASLTAASAALNFSLNLVLIPRYQARGAIVATVVSYAVLLALGTREVVQTFSVRVDRCALWRGVRTLLASGLAGCAGWWVFSHSIKPEGPYGWWVLLAPIPVAAGYAAALAAFRVVRPDELRMMFGKLLELKK